MKVTVLGAGSAYGTPMIFNRWRDACPHNPKNCRNRASILLEDNGKSVLVDAGPDVRLQINAAQVEDIHAVLFTHGHYDHIGGLPELPRASSLLEHGIDVWASEETMSELKSCYGYLFRGEEPEGVGLHWKTLPNKGEFDCCGLVFKTFQVPHHHLHSSAFRYGDFAYVTDWEEMTEDGFDILDGVKFLMLECNNGICQEKNGHSHLESVKKVVAQLKPERVVLTHLSARVDYDEFSQQLPNDKWSLAYDGVVFDI